jgi:capsule synthesis protein PGA_cap
MVRKSRSLRSVISALSRDLKIATASERVRLATAIASARSRADLVACLVHWGIENTDTVTDEQRELARWLVNRGVDIVVGRTHIVFSRSTFIMAAQSHIRWVISSSMARRLSHHGIIARYSK